MSPDNGTSVTSSATVSSGSQPTPIIGGYLPSLIPAVIAFVAYGIVAGLLWFRFWRHDARRSKFMLPLNIGTTTMMIGYIVRIARHTNPKIGPYIMETFFILLSPCAYLAQLYILLPRLVSWIDADEQLFLGSSKILRIFLISDAVTLWMQGGGGGLTAARESEIMRLIGNIVVLTGLGLQFVSLCLFTILTVVFMRRIRITRTHQNTKWCKRYTLHSDSPPLLPTLSSIQIPRVQESPNHGGYKDDWRVLVYIIIFQCTAILVRSVFRIIEYADGYGGAVMNSEWAFYCFDTVPLFLCVCSFVFFWPPVLLNSRSSFRDPQFLTLEPIDRSDDAVKEGPPA